jgi:hypothetical protein
LEKIFPTASQATAEAIEIIDGHVPLARFDPLQGSTIDVGLLRQLFLGQAGGVAQSIDVFAHQDMSKGGTVHPGSMRFFDSF